MLYLNESLIIFIISIVSLPIEILEKILDNNSILQLNLLLASKQMNNFKIKKSMRINLNLSVI